MPKVPIYQIDTGVPAPASGPVTRDRVPVHELEPGESILFPLELRRGVTALAQRLKKEEGRKFTIKKQDEKNARVWRVE